MTPLEYYNTLTNQIPLDFDGLLQAFSSPFCKGLFMKVTGYEDPYFVWMTRLNNYKSGNANKVDLIAVNLTTMQVQRLEDLMTKKTVFTVASWGNIDNARVIQDEETLHTLGALWEANL